MVKLRRILKEDFIADTQPPQTAVLYYGLKPESSLQEYQFFFTVYDKKRTPSSILKDGNKPDYIFKTSSRHSLENEIQNSNFLTDKDFGAINKYRDGNTRTFIGYIVEPRYSADKDSWDYASVFLDIHNNIIVEWRH